MGPLKIEVRFDGVAIPKSPFEFTVGNDPTKIQVGPQSARIQAGEKYSINVDTSKAGLGKLKALADSPTVSDSCVIKDCGNGIYCVDFTPLKVGPLKVKVTFDGDAILQSPFEFTVNDPTKVKVVNLPEGRLQVSKSYSFNIDTTEAGLGELKVTAHGPTGPKSLSVKDIGNGVHLVDFIPQKVGPSKIKVSFDGVTIPKSPFKFSIKDPTKIQVGPQSARIRAGEKYSINVDTSKAGFGKLEALAHGSASCVIKDSGNGIYFVDLTPSKVGPFKVDVTFDGDSVPHNPFEFTVNDPTKVKVVNLPEGRLQVSKSYSFSIDTTEAGFGELKVTAHGHTGPKSLSVIGNGVHFTPLKVGPLKIEVRFDGVAIPNSPFEFTVNDPTKVKVVNLPEGKLQISKSYSFSIDTTEAGFGELKVTAHGPTGPKFLSVIGNGVVNFTPQKVGPLKIEVRFDGVAIPNSSFEFTVGKDLTKIQVGPQSARIQAGEKYSINVDTSKAGLGELKALADGPTVSDSCAIKDCGNGIYYVDFTPLEVGPLKVKVTFDGDAILQSPFEFTVNDPTKVKVVNLPEGRLQVSKSYSFSIDTTEAGFGALKVTEHGPTGPKSLSVKDIGNGVHLVDFTPQKVGPLKIKVSFDGVAIPKSPFEFTVNDPTKVQVGLNFTQSARLQAGEKYSINVDTSKAGFGELKALARGPTVSNSCAIKDSGNGIFCVNFTPTEVGSLKVEITFDGCAILYYGEEFEFTVNDPSKVELDVAAIKDATYKVNETAKFVVSANHAGDGEITILVIGRKGEEKVSVVDQGGKHYLVSFLPTQATQHAITILFDGHHIPDVGTFEIFVNRTVVTEPPVSAYLVGVPYEFKVIAETQVIARSVLQDEVMVTCKGIRTGLEPSIDFLKNYGSCQFRVILTASMPDDYILSIQVDEEHVPGSPFKLCIEDKPQADKVVCAGPFYKVGSSEPVTFDVNAENAGAGKLSASCSGSKGSVNITEKEQEPKKYVLAFTPPEDDIYVLNVYWMSENIKGSPFEINLIPPDASRCIVNGPEVPIDPTEPIVFYVDASNAGNGAIAVSAVGDETGEKDVLVKETEPHKYVLSFMPNISEMYTMNVTWGGENVPGAPFRVSNSAMNILICEPPPTTIEAGQAIGTCFDTSKGGKGTLTAICKGNSTGEIPTTLSVAEDKYNIRFIPPKPDVFIVRVLWNGVDIKGSPFTINLILADRKTHESMPHGPFFIEYIEAPAEKIPTHPITKPYLIQYLPDDNTEDLLFYAIHDKSCTGTTLNVRKGRENKTYFILKAEKTGLHHIHIKHKDKDIHGSPFKLEIIKSDSSACKIVKAPDRAYIGEEVSLKIDITKAGSGDMHVHITAPPDGRSTEFNHVEDPLGLYTIKFTPKVAGKYEMIIKWAGVPIPGCPVTINAYDFSERVQQARDAASRVEVRDLNHIFESKLPLSGTVTFIIATKQGSHGELTVKAEGPGDAEINLHRQKNSEYQCKVCPTVSGKYDITISWNGFPIPGDPFQFDYTAENFYFTNKVYLESVHCFLGHPYEFHFYSDQNEEDILEVYGNPKSRALEVSGHPISRALEVSSHPESCAIIPPNKEVGSTYSVKIAPKMESNNQISIKLAEEHVIHSPYDAIFELSSDQEVEEDHSLLQSTDLDFPIFLADSPPDILPKKVRAYGPGLKDGRIGQEGNFTIETGGAGDGKLEVSISGAMGTFRTKMRCHPVNNRTMLVRYDPTDTGLYTINILWCGEHIKGSDDYKGSPFVVDIKPQDTL